MENSGGSLVSSIPEDFQLQLERNTLTSISEAIEVAHSSQTQELLDGLNAIPPSTSPLTALQYLVESFFAKGEEKASNAFQMIWHGARRSHPSHPFKFSQGKVFVDPPEWWQDNDESFFPAVCVPMLLALLATEPDEALLDARAFSQSMPFGPRHNLDLTVRSRPSASLQTAFQDAKTAAQGPKGSTTLLVVDLLDVHWQESLQIKPFDHTKFTHVFVLGFGPEGMIVWQCGGKPAGKPAGGYYIKDYLESGGGRVRDWKEAEVFVAKFEKLVNGTGKGPWNHKRDKLYKELFEVSLFEMSGPEKLMLPITTKFKPWVGIMAIKDVQASHVSKFYWDSPDMSRLPCWARMRSK